MRQETVRIVRVVLGFILLGGGAGVGFGQIVITEIMYDPSAVTDANGEWFEIYNAGASAVNINGWSIEEADGSPSHTIDNGGALNIAAGTYAVLARNGTTATNGGVTAVYAYGSWALSNSSDSIRLKNGTTVVDTVSYSETGSDPFPVASGASIALALAESDLGTGDNNVASNWCLSKNAWSGSAGDKGTPGAANDCTTGPTTFTGEIYEIQGSGAASPQLNALATTEDNVVTAVGAGGFFIQTPTADSDNDADTSDGLFVLHGGTPAVVVGDQVDVTGTVEEFFGYTRIDATVDSGSVSIDASNQPLPAPIEFGATRPSPDPASPSCAIEFECYEGMLIRIATGTVSGPSQSFGSDPVAEMYITPTAGRAFREKGVEYPGLASNPGVPVWDGNPELFELDPDKLGLDNVSWVPGTTFAAVGVLGYEFSGYEIWPKELTALTVAPPLPHPARPRRAGEVSVASINMLNLDDAHSGYGTKRNKLSLYIRYVLRSPDVVGVQEVYSLKALQGLAAEIRRDDPSVSYTPYLAVGNRVPGINVGFLVRSGVSVRSITQHGKSETYLNPATNMNDLLHDRPPLLLDAAVPGLEFSVVVVHNRSLIDVDTERVQAKRLAQAQSVARLAQSLQDRKLIIVGDFNAFQFTDGYVDVMGQIAGNVTESENLLSGPDLVDPDLVNLIERVPEAQRYSYSYQNNAQVLDHALVNEEMAGSVVDIQYARGNVDARTPEANDIDSPLRASDHDGFVVYLSAPGRTDIGGPVEPEPEPEPGAQLSLSASSEILSEDLVRFVVSVRNDGPGDAPNVVVTSSLTAADRSSGTSTSGCREDPDGVPECSRGHIEAGESESFTIDVEIDAASANSLTYTGTVESDAADESAGDDSVEATLVLGRPAAPSGLEATALSETEVELRWRDNSDRETGFAVFLQGPGDSKLRLIGTAPADTTSMVVNELVPSIAYGFAVEARNGELRSERTPKAEATTWVVDAARCGEDDALCIGAFQVEVEWNDGKGRMGGGFAERLTADAGDFWFFQPTNIELVVKVLDGCAINDRYWVYAAGLTDVGVSMTVRDLRSGVEKIWTNPVGTRFQPITDSEAFATCGDGTRVNSQGRVVLSGAPRDRAGELYAAALSAADPIDSASGACAADDAAICLLGSRFHVRADWEAGGRTGAAAATPRTADTGMFWFFSPDNVELVVKVLDGCRENGYRWVLMGGLTDVGVEVVVTDGESGKARIYRRLEGTPFPPMFDVTAFACDAGE